MDTVPPKKPLAHRKGRAVIRNGLELSFQVLPRGGPVPTLATVQNWWETGHSKSWFHRMKLLRVLVSDDDGRGWSFSSQTPALPSVQPWDAGPGKGCPTCAGAGAGLPGDAVRVAPVLLHGLQARNPGGRKSCCMSQEKIKKKKR